MKRLPSSDSSTPLISICPSTEEHSPMYGRDFQSMLDGLEEEGCVEEVGQKKRRLSIDQVKALEKNFEVENKLEPERKVKLAQELGLQPRQVAVWFQNRRARWKTKQLERDFGVLKANYDALKLNFDTINHDNEALRKQIKELKSRLQEEVLVKEEEITMMMPATEDKTKATTTMEQSNKSDPCSEYEEDHLNYECFNNSDVPNSLLQNPVDYFKDGSSDSDSSAILNEDENNNKCFLQLQKTTLHAQYYVKMEEQNFLSADEACNFFCDEQAPTLQWYCPDQWSL